jgi:hypothetical protein
MIAFPFIDRIVRGTLAAAELDFLRKRLWRRVLKPVNRLAGDPAIFLNDHSIWRAQAQKERALPDWQSPSRVS